MPDFSTVSVILGSSLSAAVLTQAVNVLQQCWSRRSRRRFSGLYLALALDAYGRDCSTNLTNHINFIDTDGAAGCQAELLPPLPSYSGEIDWAAVGIKATVEAFQFRVDIDHAVARAQALSEYSDSEDGLADALRGTAELGLRAFKLADFVLVHAGIPFKGDRSTAGARANLEMHKEKLREANERYLVSRRDSGAQAIV